MKIPTPNHEPEPAPSPFIDWSAFWNRDRSEEQWVLERVLAKGRAHAVYASAKAGKSLFLLWAAAELATRPEPVVVVYLDYEMTEDDLYERLADMGYEGRDLTRLRYWLLPTLGPLDTAEGAAELLELVDGLREEWPGHELVLVIDTTGRAVEGPEDKSDTFRAFYRHAGLQLKQRGITYVRLDHVGRDASKGQRGSSSKSEDVDVVWRLERAANGYQLRRDVARMGWVPERVPVERLTEPLRFSIGGAVWPAGTLEVAERLAELGVPAEASVKVSGAALREVGASTSNEVLSAAVRYRKALHRGDSGTPPERERNASERPERSERLEPEEPTPEPEKAPKRSGTPTERPRNGSTERGNGTSGTPRNVRLHHGGTPDGTKRNGKRGQSGTLPPPRGGNVRGLDSELVVEELSFDTLDTAELLELLDEPDTAQVLAAIEHSDAEVLAALEANLGATPEGDQ